MRPLGYYGWKTQATVPQSPVHTSGKDVPLSADVNGEYTEMATWPNDGGSETTGTALRVSKFDVTHYRQEEMLFRVKQINDPENLLRDVGNSHVLSLVHFFRTYTFIHARGAFSVTTTATVTNSKIFEGALSSTRRVLDEAVPVVLLERGHRLQALHEL